MSSVIWVAGPNAAGKTTALRRWKQHLQDKVHCVTADNNREIDVTGEKMHRDPRWSGTMQEKQEILQELFDSDDPVPWIVESCRTPPIPFAKRLYCVFTLTKGPAMARNLEERCDKKGKRFKKEFWTPKRCHYESHDRQLRWIGKHEPICCKVLWVDKREDQWPRADHYVIQLAKRLHR